MEAQATDTKFHMVSFNGRMMVEAQERFKRYIPLHKKQFEEFAYQTEGDISRTRINDLYAYARSTAKDLSENDHLIVFGNQVWDTKRLVLRKDIDIADCIWRSPYSGVVNLNGAPVQFVMDLAGNNQGLYDDIMQSLAPLIMNRKPVGAIWWIGSEDSGIGALLGIVHQLFPGQLTNLSMECLIGGRKTPLLNETFGNIATETSNGQVKNTDVYKSIATHENFRAHKYHYQSGVEIRGNVHHIFSASQAPTFSRKGHSIEWRTFAIPFPEPTKLSSDFKQQRLTAKMFGQLITEMFRYANRIKAQGYRYQWSDATTSTNPSYTS